MVRLREIPRTATFAWSPGNSSPFLATGTRAGAVDADFSNDTQLELWDLDLNNTEQGIELQPAASIATDSRFHDISWVQPKDGFERGVVAGALENGSLDLWDAQKLLDGDEDAFMSRTSKHSGAIKTLQFNPFRSELLATAGAKGELFISDLNNIANPFRLGNSAARADDFECLDWNKKVPHIMVTGSSGGFVTVWDVKAKKESLTLNNLGRKPVGAVAWDPEKPTRLITAVPLDTDPLILVWDLRNSNAPERVLRGHEGGVLSLSWCQQDSDLLLSCGKDNRTICWNPQTGEPYGEFPVVTNWTFQTRWNPHNPSILATASFDGKISVQTVQNTKTESEATGTQAQALDGEDFFNKAQTQPQTASFTLPKAPKWLERPCGASFGFGGKIISFTHVETEGSSARGSLVRLSNFAVDSEIGTMTEAFEKAMSEHDLTTICGTRINDAKSEAEKNDWKVIETLTTDNPRKELITYLGLSHSDDEAADDLSKLNINGEGDRLSASQVNGAKNNRLSAFFDNSQEGDNFLSDLAATKGAKTNNPFHIYSDSEPESDKKIIRALMLGQFDKAMEVCLREDRMSDAFMIAICGGQQAIDKVQKAYFAKQASGPKYLRLLASVVRKNLWDVVYNADLENWRDVMAILCTYASAEEFPDLCEALGDRLEEQLSHEPDNSGLRSDASFCYIAGSKLEKVIGVWIAELEDAEKSGMQDAGKDSTFSIHAKLLQSFVEKVTVFRDVTHYQDKERRATSNWKLAPLYEKYTEYADIVAAHGQLQIAERYLDLLPDKYPAAELARNRVKQATRKANVPAATRQPVSTTMPPQRAPTNVPRFEDQRAPASKPSNQPANPYDPVSLNQSQSQYGQQGQGSYGAPGYAPAQGYAPQQQPRQQFGIPPPPNYGAPIQTSAAAPPPRNQNATPSAPPPPKTQNVGNWNDIPESFVKPPTSRRGTPSVQPNTINASFPNQTTVPTPPMANQPFNMQPRSAPSVPPPPRGSAPPPRTMTPQMNGPRSYQAPDRPSSSASNLYAPVHINEPTSILPQPQIPRGPSPYNAPPAGVPSGNRYAPAPVTQAPAQPNQRPPPPPNPFASRQSFSGPSEQSRNQYGAQASPSQQSGPPTQSNIQAGPPQGPPPSVAQLQRSKPARPATPKYPPGDRSHIPSSAQPIYDILNSDMQRVKGKAPASFKAQVTDTEKRLNILFDLLNNEDLLKPNTVQDMVELAQALRARDFDQAQAIHIDLLTNRLDECGNWMVGVKRLIGMSRATP
ncbi:protein transport protein S31 [Xylographa carneopallida]|nr:protein transport protein S31 [Xylographa carneopallida]